MGLFEQKLLIGHLFLSSLKISDPLVLCFYLTSNLLKKLMNHLLYSNLLTPLSSATTLKISS